MSNRDSGIVEELDLENKALKAKLHKMESLAFELENSTDESLDIANIVSAAYELPDQSLADIKADAVRDAANNLIIDSDRDYDIREIFLKYADKLRGKS